MSNQLLRVKKIQYQTQMNYAWLPDPQKAIINVRVLSHFMCGTFTQQLTQACHNLLCFALLHLTDTVFFTN